MEFDLRKRYAAGESPRVDDYLHLACSPTSEMQLIAVEYTVRSTHESTLAIEEYSRRFPQFSAALPSLLRSKPTGMPRESSQVQCPNCHNTMTTLDDESLSDATCPSCGSSVRPDPDHTLDCTCGTSLRLGKFELHEVIGHGAFGTVYRAIDQELSRTVAVKVPRSGAFATKHDELRFVREARCGSATVASRHRPRIRGRTRRVSSIHRHRICPGSDVVRRADGARFGQP